jgi:hypothetical protein
MYCLQYCKGLGCRCRANRDGRGHRDGPSRGAAGFQVKLSFDHRRTRSHTTSMTSRCRGVTVSLAGRAPAGHGCHASGTECRRGPGPAGGRPPGRRRARPRDWHRATPDRRSGSLSLLVKLRSVPVSGSDSAGARRARGLAPPDRRRFGDPGRAAGPSLSLRVRLTEAPGCQWPAGGGHRRSRQSRCPGHCIEPASATVAGGACE